MNTRGMKKDRTVLIAVSLTVVFMLAAGLAWWSAHDSPAEPPRALPSAWPSANAEAIRPVPMPTGEMAAALPFGTRGQVLCNAVPEDTWRKVLGGPVLREVSGAGDCHVITADLEVTAGTYDRPSLGGFEPAVVTVAGHPGTLTKSTGTDAVLTVRLSDTAEQWAAPELQLRVANQVGVRAERDFRGMAEELGTAMVGAITTPGPSLPNQEEQAHPPEMTPIAGTGVADSAYPLIMRQLCTQLAKALGLAPEAVEPDWPGTCKHKAGGAEVELSYNPTSLTQSFGDRFAGRPADVSEPGGVIEVQLVDGSPQTLVLRVSDLDRTLPGIRELAEKVVPPLLGR
ncbi:hypothetical protein AB0J40_13960 [Amycolatopsis sp. NPDC049691]|uniref:hypothetical protein n=1 Tax=Amycolatopsis sp. NPDC049691 TaxID=3155155 RepID=UPI0034146836